ncbi:hypothetical protein EC991_010857, partial [Linnemannia zychae]
MVQTPEIFLRPDDDSPLTSPCHCQAGTEKEKSENKDSHTALFYQDLLLRVLTSGSMSMTALQSKEFKSLMSFSNPVIGVPGEDALWSRLEINNRMDKLELIQYLRQEQQFGSITADAWTSSDNRKFFAVTYHYLTPNFTLDKVIIGMEEINQPSQTAEVLQETL